MAVNIFPPYFSSSSELNSRVSYLENAEFKITYFSEISAISGQLVTPIGSSILLNQWAGNVDALYSPLEGGKPSYESTAISVVAFDVAGNYTLSEAPPVSPAALVYTFTISLKDFGNLNPEFIVEFAELNTKDGVAWLYPYTAGTYPKGTMTRVGDWTAIANTDTSEYPVPQYNGEEFNVYQGTISTQSVNARQVIFGTRYTASTSAYVKAYKIYTIAGNNYKLYTVTDPTGTQIIDLAFDFTATTSGWVELSISPTLVLSSNIFDVIAVVQEPDPTPTTFTGDWDYQKPTNETAPLAGQVTHSSKALNKIRISYTDSLSADRTVELQSLNVGDIITVSDISWAIQSSLDQTTYIEFDIAPSTQSTGLGATTFTFETKAETPISFAIDADYYLGNANVSGLFAEDEGYGNITVNDNAYGVDLLVQEVIQSTEWDIVASSANIGQGTDPQLTALLDQITVVSEGDDKGVEFAHQLSAQGEIIAGKDSYPVPVAFHCTVADTTGKTIVNATDVTSILQSDSGSFTGMFGGTTAGSYILVGSVEQYEGAKVKYESLATVEPDNITAEFYRNDVDTWVNVAFMGTNSDFPYEAHGDQIATDNHTAEQIFFGFDPLTRDQPSTWEALTFNINGQDYTYKWARFRITAPITGDPQVEQIKLHTDRIEFEYAGIFKYGRARSPIQLVAGVSQIVKNDLSDPANEVVAYTPNFSAAYLDNELANNAIDGFGIVVNRTFGLDTSVPLVVALSFYVKGTATGDVEFNFETSQVIDGYVYNGTEPFTASAETVTIAAPADLVRKTVQFRVPINKLQANSGIVVNLYRDATGTNPEDTLAANIVITNVVVTGFAWKI